MITQKLSKKEIVAGIKELAHKSTIGKNAYETGVYTVNELIYFAERLQEGIGAVYISLGVEGCCVPIMFSEPTFIDIKTRSKRVRIRDVVVDEDDSNGYIEYYYWIVTETVKEESSKEDED